MGIHAQFALVNRAAIEAEIERLIAMLDDLDGDCDLEEDDPAGGNVLDMELDEDAEALRPLYAEDQSAGPINALTANQRYDLARQIETYSDGGDPRWVRQLQHRLATVEAREEKMLRMLGVQA